MLGEYKKHRSTEYRSTPHGNDFRESGIKVSHIRRPRRTRKRIQEKEATEAFHEAVRLLASRAGNKEGYIPCILGRIHIHSQTLLLSVLCLEDPCPAARASGMSSTLRFFQRPGQNRATRAYPQRSRTCKCTPHTPPTCTLSDLATPQSRLPFPMFSWSSSEPSPGIPPIYKTSSLQYNSFPLFPFLPHGIFLSRSSHEDRPRGCSVFLPHTGPSFIIISMCG